MRIYLVSFNDDYLLVYYVVTNDPPGSEKRSRIKLLPFRLEVRGGSGSGDLALAVEQVAQHCVAPLPEIKVKAE